MTTRLLEDATTQTQQEPRFWLLKFRSTIFFFPIVLTIAGIYLATQIPISVFPETNFPRVVIGVDNGVMPVEQMEVTITKPIEDAVNIVPGLVTVRSTTSRGSAEVSLFFDWNVDMYRTLQLVDAALSKVQQIAAAHREDHHQPADLRHVSDSRLQPYVRHDVADAAVGDGDLRAEASAEPRSRREHGDSAGRQDPGVPHRSGPGAPAGLGRHHHRPRRPRSKRRTSSIRRDCMRPIINSSWGWWARRCTMPRS